MFWEYFSSAFVEQVLNSDQFELFCTPKLFQDDLIEGVMTKWFTNSQTDRDKVCQVHLS